jgi:hypothetical protein
MPLRSKQRLVLVKTEGSNYGTDSSPDGSNALFINDDIQLTPLAGDVTQRRVIRPYMGAYEGLISNTQVGISFSLELAGSGTAGTAPRYADLLRSCRTSQTVTGSPLTGTAQAGANESITLAASGTSSVDNFYNGQIITITSGTGSGAVGQITSYNGTTKVASVIPLSGFFTPGASSGYSIAANVAFKPISIIDGIADTSCTICYNIDGVQHKLLGCRGNVALNANLGEIPSLQFTMTGVYVTPTDTAQSGYTLAYANQAVPAVFRDDNVKAFRFFGQSGCLQMVSFDFGNQIVYRERIGCTKRVDLIDAQANGQVMMEATTMAAFNPFTESLAEGTYGRLNFVHGTTAGNQVGLVVPQCDLGQPSYSSDNGVEMFNLPFTAPPAVANDDFYLVFS